MTELSHERCGNCKGPTRNNCDIMRLTAASMSNIAGAVALAGHPSTDKYVADGLTKSFEELSSALSVTCGYTKEELITQFRKA